MSIPLDKLYHYIENVANEINKDIQGDNVIIYHFYPHGSKNLEDLLGLRPYRYSDAKSINMYCYDQEPLQYDLYETQTTLKNNNTNNLFIKYNQHNFQLLNLRQYSNIYDKALLLHSEVRSNNVKKYTDGEFIPVYYWCHAIIARDWYRYARYERLNKNVKNIFLIYNRAWAGTREYRLKFIDLLIQNNILHYCQTTFNQVDPETTIHYRHHQYDNFIWKPDNNLENYNINTTRSLSSSSADYNIDDYNSTDFEVVLEKLFDDDRIQLTEKILRPIALGQPFLLSSTHGSLEYLRSYGFKTFEGIIDETYDTIVDPYKRLEAIVKCMKDITNWCSSERIEKIALTKEITRYNQQHFFSDTFFNTIIDELKINLTQGLRELESTNTSKWYLERRKILYKYCENTIPLMGTSAQDRQYTAEIVSRARKYYNRRLQQQ